MQFKMITAVSAIVLGLASTASAVDINQQGAKDIETNLSKLLPRKVGKSFITVNPAGTRYEIVYDFAKLLQKVDPASFTINGLAPWSIFATPEESGLWTIEGTNSLDVSGSFTAAGQPKTDFSYAIDSLVSKGVFDPAISYLKSGDFSSKAVRFSSKTEQEEVSAETGPSNYKLTSSDSEMPGRTNFAGSGTIASFVEKISGKEVPPVEIRADSVDFAAAVNGVSVKNIRDIVAFLIEHSDQKRLRRAESKVFKEMVSKAFPLMTSLNETVTLNKVSVTSVAGNGGADTIDYTIGMSGPTDAMRFDVGMAAKQISFESALVPEMYAAFVPSEMQVQMAFPEINAAAFGDELMKIDLSDEKKKTDAETDKMFEKLISGGMVVEFPKISARSSVYDVEVSGEVRGTPLSKTDYSMNASILVRDFDKTLTAIQELAKANPELNQVSFGLMMVKGFGKADPDGRQRWDVSVTRDGSVTVNGQVIKGAN
ncbi:hypothetical protein [Rhizobium sp. 18055]|uniref:hypothetical protein n=1 Tax=Rhizobium sp. 18055 TaxID=2681403 RepID=UPI001356A137|nr:hypothetical protein [Rhizobium sp. 18055]